MGRLFGCRITHVAAGTVTLQMFKDGRISMPIAALYGVQLHHLEENRSVLSIPASEWFCSFGPNVSSQALAADVTVRNAEGKLIARTTAALARIDASKRQGRQRKASRRVLATLLFSDMVDSTGHATRLGEEHRLKVRRENSRFNGTEVDNAGDGFFVRFDSPAYAIEAARTARAARKVQVFRSRRHHAQGRARAMAALRCRRVISQNIRPLKHGRIISDHTERLTENRR